MRPVEGIPLAGPDGAGKSTAAPFLLPGAPRIRRFLNADTIARGLSGFDPDAEAPAAGRILLAQMDDSVRDRLDFAVETTLSGRTLAARARRTATGPVWLVVTSVPPDGVPYGCSHCSFAPSPGVVGPVKAVS